MNSSSTLTTQQAIPAPAWWHFRIVWLVVGGPAVVVVASFFTLYLAISHPDPVLPTLPVVSAEGDHGDQVAKPDAVKAALLPALVGRNHAATAGSVR
jgi:hypothetical protein